MSDLDSENKERLAVDDGSPREDVGEADVSSDADNREESETETSVGESSVGYGSANEVDASPDAGVIDDEDELAATDAVMAHGALEEQEEDNDVDEEAPLTSQNKVEDGDGDDNGEEYQNVQLHTPSGKHEGTIDEQPQSQPKKTVAVTGQYRTTAVQRRVEKSRLTKRLAAGLPVLEDDILQGADTLRTKSREIYEYTRFKILTSLLYGAMFLVCLGFAGIAGGNGNFYLNLHYALEEAGWETVPKSLSGYTGLAGLDLALEAEQLGILTRAYGFACFLNIVAGALTLVAAVSMSPFLNGFIAEAEHVTRFHSWKRKRPDGKYEPIPLPHHHFKSPKKAEQPNSTQESEV